MHYNFNTDSSEHGKAALILYAIYRSRNRNSSLNGIETWNRFTSFVRGACLKSTTTAEFVNHFCHMAKVDSIKPKYLKTDGLTLLPTGEVVESSEINDFRLQIISDNRLLTILRNEYVYITMLVRDRIQREKISGIEDVTEDEYED